MKVVDVQISHLLRNAKVWGPLSACAVSTYLGLSRIISYIAKCCGLHQRLFRFYPGAVQHHPLLTLAAPVGNIRTPVLPSRGSSGGFRVRACSIQILSKRSAASRSWTIASCVAGFPGVSEKFLAVAHNRMINQVLQVRKLHSLWA